MGKIIFWTLKKRKVSNSIMKMNIRHISAAPEKYVEKVEKIEKYYENELLY